MDLTQKEKDKLWGEDGPYSQANIIIQERILDDSVSRVFIEVEASINPLTYEIIKKNRDEFKGDLMIQQLLDHSDYRGQKHGYISCAFHHEYIDENVMKEARKALEYTRKTIIKMHKYVMRTLSNLKI